MLRIFTLLLLSIPNLSFALGLGDIDLKSNLGEPFFAKVMITDVDSAPDAACFSAMDNNDPPAFKKAHIVIKSINDSHQLSITTNEAITEPIINLRVSIHCEPNLNREYVLLLDPASITNTEKTSAPAAPTAQVKAIDQSKPKNNSHALKSQPQALNKVETTPIAENSAENNISNKKITKKNRSRASTTDSNLMEAYVGKQQTIQPKSASEIKIGTNEINRNSSIDKPHLIISGGSTNSASNMPNLSLRLETQLDLNRAEIAPAPLTAADAADEVTVMANRLAHLEKQIIGLQTQNALLRNEAEKAKSTELHSADQDFNWMKDLPIILGIVLITGIVSAGVWLRRKILRKRLYKQHDNWFDTDKSKKPDNLPKSDILISDENIFNESSSPKTNSDDIDDDQFTNKSRNGFFPYPTAFTVTETDSSENVLDHAEVFLAHDRPAMAIQLLQNHLVDLPVESPEIWLKLINLLASEGTEAEYDNAVTACKQFFNVKLPKFSDASTEDQSTIEDYPHIIARLQDVWGSEFAVEFLNDLIFNKQSQPREGFGRKTFEELFFLKQIAISLHASNKSSVKPNQPDETKPALTTMDFDVMDSSQEHSSQNEMDYGMTVDIAPKEKSTTSSIDRNSLQDKLTAESFLNAPDASENEIELFFTTTKKADTQNVSPQPAPSLNATLKAEEIDFSDFLTEMTTDPAPEVIFPETSSQDEELTLTSHVIANKTQEVIQELEIAENKPEEADEKARTAPLMIEWELPKLGKE